MIRILNNSKEFNFNNNKSVKSNKRMINQEIFLDNLINQIINSNYQE
jgi:hypothetical protein